MRWRRRICAALAIVVACGVPSSAAPWPVYDKYSGCTWLNPDTVCKDSANAGILLVGKPASCTQLQPYCNYGGGWDVLIQSACPKSCGVCPAETGPKQIVSSPSEWEAALPQVGAAAQLNATVRIPIAGNEEGCQPHADNYFAGKVAVLARGQRQCSFVQKAWNAEAAGAVAVLLYDNTGVTTVQLMATTLSARRPTIPTWFISWADGSAMSSKVKSGEECQVVCGWAPIQTWYDHPTDWPKQNDTVTLSNTGNESYLWTFDVHPRLFEQTPDPFYSCAVASNVSQWKLNAGGGTAAHVGFFSGAVVVDNGAYPMGLPFEFPLYLKYFDTFHVSSNGLLVFGSDYTAGGDATAALGTDDGANGVVAPFWDDLVCDSCTIDYVLPPSGHATGYVRAAVIRFHNMTSARGQLSFDAWLFADGRISFVYRDVGPLGSLGSAQIGVESRDAKRHVLCNTVAEGSFASGGDFEITVNPWFLPMANTIKPVEPGGSVEFFFKMDLLPTLGAWLVISPTRVGGTALSKRYVRIKHTRWQLAWSVSEWDGACHSGPCMQSNTASRNVTCQDTAKLTYPGSVCNATGSCWDTDLTWRDKYGNSCPDYSALAYCTQDGGYGATWRSAWGTFESFDSGSGPATTVCCACGAGSTTWPDASMVCPVLPCPANSSGANVKAATSATAITAVSPTSLTASRSSGLALTFSGTAESGDLAILILSTSSCTGQTPTVDVSSGLGYFTVAPAGTYKLCFREKGGSDSVEQTDISVTALSTTAPETFSSLTPSSISASYTSTVAFFPLPASGDKAEFVASGSACPGIPGTDISSGSASFILGSAGAKDLCLYTVAGGGIVKQTSVTLTVVSGTPSNTITAILPTTIFVGSATSIALSGHVVDSYADFVLIGTPCSAILPSTTLTASGVGTFSFSNPGTYTLCYRQGGRTDSINQVAVSLVVAAAGVGNDPIAWYSDLKRVFVLPPGELVPLLKAPDMTLSGSTFEGVTPAEQWFGRMVIESPDGGRFMEIAIRKDILSFNRSGAPRNGFETLEITMGGQSPQNELLATRVPTLDTPIPYSFFGADVVFRRVLRSDRTQFPTIGRARRECMDFVGGYLHFYICSAAAWEYFGWQAHLAVRFAHLDLVIVQASDMKQVSGLLPELWGLKPLSKAGAAFLSAAGAHKSSFGA